MSSAMVLHGGGLNDESRQYPWRVRTIGTAVTWNLRRGHCCRTLSDGKRRVLTLRQSTHVSEMSPFTASTWCSSPGHMPAKGMGGGGRGENVFVRVCRFVDVSAVWTHACTFLRVLVPRAVCEPCELQKP